MNPLHRPVEYTEVGLFSKKKRLLFTAISMTNSFIFSYDSDAQNFVKYVEICEIG